MADSQPKSWFSWLGLRVGGRLVLFYIHHVNRVNFRNDLVVMMTVLYYRPGYYITFFNLPRPATATAAATTATA